ncbi:putative cysteine-rich repeat secretory protein 38-like [Capsicum annuum]|uniref:Phytocyanin domain-containing protein n=2 Tax=Capsicum annuum TaxID=4072 RepID=A0A2G2YTT2_CAPAN|nr:putative cysteine-rich repeat secretory protein 38-like [Capsicum annuum]KAF3676749.1 putative cysteine-rich repeat secretory protein 38-like [Capsicum annuum]PHT73187.1 hypothetical protein T459_23972 [Capsicum annuum]
MAMVRLLMSLATIAMVFGFAIAANHTVGAPNGGWNQNTDLKTWAASETFVVGDSLVFTYTPNHDVLEVNKADYDSCQTTNAISTNGGGMTVISLSSTGKRYFICGTGGHCASGMKLEVNTLATVPPPIVAPAISPAKSPVSAPSPKNAPKVSPVSSPSPKSSAPSPKIAPKISPAKSPVASSPSPITVEAPTLPPPADVVPTASPTSPSQPSSADKISVVASSSVGFGIVAMIFFMHEQSGQGHSTFSSIELVIQEQSGQGHSTVVSKFLVLGKFKFTEYVLAKKLDSMVPGVST